MNNTSGFYKYESETLLYGPTQVTGPYYDILRENRTDYTYPVYGWHWFESEELAREFFGLPPSTDLIT
jgi:hypothetical protein